MLLRDGHNELEILLLERMVQAAQCRGDLHFSIRVAYAGFTGKYDALVDAPTMERFLVHLNSVEEVRRGEATLEAMSPEEFRLTISCIDPTCHVAASGQLARWANEGPGAESLWCVVPYNLSLDPSLLPHMLREFRQFFSVGSAAA